MKKTIEEKKIIIDEACELYNEAAELIKKAKKLFLQCGIEFCGGFYEETSVYTHNLQIYSGIMKLKKIIDVKPYNPNRYITGKPDEERLTIKYKGLTFLQLGDATEKPVKYEFK